MDFVTVAEYNHYKYVIFCVIVAVGIVTAMAQLIRAEALKVPAAVTVVLALVCIYMVGNYPDIAGDANSDKFYYWVGANDVLNGFGAMSGTGFGFYLITKLVVSFLPIEAYFLALAAIYVFGILFFCRSLSKDDFGIIFIAMILNFQFVGYGTNTIRAGLASAFVLVGMGAFRDNRYFGLLLFAVGVSVHKSWLLPVACYLMACYKDKTNVYLVLWLVSIVVSAVAGSVFQPYADVILGEDRMGYFANDSAGGAYKSGFRLDFLIYSCLPVAFGYYYIYKCRFKDKYYKVLYNMYLMANACWILVIRANFTDRFAYLSWFIYSALLIYPLVKDQNMVAHQRSWLAGIILGLTAFNMWIL